MNFSTLAASTLGRHKRVKFGRRLAINSLNGMNVPDSFKAKP